MRHTCIYFIRVCVCMHSRIRVLDWHILCVYFGLDTSELHCIFLFGAGGYTRQFWANSSLIPDIVAFQNKDAQTIQVDLGQSLRIPCPAHGASYGAVYTWSGDENIEFSRNPRRAISASGELFIMFVTEEDITRIQQLKGIRCTITGANTFYRSGPITLRKSGNNLLWHNTLYWASSSPEAALL